MKQWIAFILATVCLLFLACCTKPPADTSSTGPCPSAPPPSTTTTSQTTPETLTPQTEPPAIRPADYDTQWGEYQGKVFMHEYLPSGKLALPVKYFLHLNADGTFRYSNDSKVAGNCAGTWSYKGNTLTLYESIYYEEIDYTFYNISRFHYENGVLTLLENENNISDLYGEFGTEYTFMGATN